MPPPSAPASAPAAPAGVGSAAPSEPLAPAELPNAEAPSPKTSAEPSAPDAALNAPPAATAQIVIDRPAPGLARGDYAWPAWAIGLVGTALLGLGIAYLLWRVRRKN